MADIDPQKYFDDLKTKKVKITDKWLDNFYEIIIHEMNKAMITKQGRMLRKLAYAKDNIERERKVLAKGFNTFILKEDIEKYINQVANKAVVIQELAIYPRTIPDEFIEKIKELKDEGLFDNFYIVFTDYTGGAKQEVAKEKRRKDPILFGAYEQKLNGIWDIHDRFYYIGDWEDEYCDLTLSKMVDAMSKKGYNIKRSVDIPESTEEEIRGYIHSLEESENNRFNIKPRKKSILSKVRAAWKALND